MILKTDTLIGNALDWAVAKAENRLSELTLTNNRLRFKPAQFSDEELYCPSTNWEQAGVIIEAHRLVLGYHGVPGSEMPCASAFKEGRHISMEFGNTVLIAAMRCLVANKLGSHIEVPQELLT